MRLAITTVIVPDPRYEGAARRLQHITDLLRQRGVSVTLLPLHREFRTMDAGSISERIEQWRQHGLAIAETNWQANVQHHPYDIVWHDSYLAAEQSMGFIREKCPGTRQVFDTVDLAHVRYFREAKVMRNQRQLLRAMATKRSEIQLATQADFTLAISQDEARTLQQLAPQARILTVPNVHPRPLKTPGFTARSGLAFIGSYHHTPNPDAVHWLCDELWPRCLELAPDLQLSIIGNGPLDDDKIALTPNMKRLGYVEDLATCLQGLRITVAPLRFGAGIKGKVLESICHGAPVVGTEIAAEGLNMPPGAGIRVTHSAEDFARAVVQLYHSQAIWEQTIHQGIDVIDQHFTQAAVGKELDSLLASLKN
ncbi:glycosyltransferase [Cerasicoccus frondis]|uniref:glycosyltransferase n=1 Tax=Cerasicoccus frondis TaxID=490090 RepID=UPI0028526F78|nr:glycosyltransferase [Cerasicoccus frondis]